MKSIKASAFGMLCLLAFVTPSLASQSVVTTPAVTGASDAGILAGTWIVDRAIYEGNGVMKEVSSATMDAVWSKITFSSGGKGTITYGKSNQDLDMEFELRDGQNATIAYGSRLKPLLDLFKVVQLSNGTLFLRSTHLGSITGTMYYVLRKQ